MHTAELHVWLHTPVETADYILSDFIPSILAALIDNCPFPGVDVQVTGWQAEDRPGRTERPVGAKPGCVLNPPWTR